MTRHFLVLAAVFLAAQISALADLAESFIIENDVAYLRVGAVGKNLADEIQSAQKELAATNKINGLILDLRFAGGDDLDSAKAAADLFAKGKLPLAVLVDGETKGAAIDLAKDLRGAHEGLIFGSSDEIRPDVVVNVNPADERGFLENPYATFAQGGTNSTGTNNFLSFVDHVSEADLVRAKIKDGDEDDNLVPERPSEPQKPLLRDPVLARAVDLMKGLAVFRQQQRS